MNIGDKYTIKSRSITVGDVDAFCRVTGITEDFFLDEEAAKSVGLRGKVVPGAQTLAVTLGMVADLTSGLLLAGMDNVRFHTPLYPNDRVSLEIELLGKKPTSKGKRVFYVYRWVLRNQNGVDIASGQNTECTT